MKIVCMTDPFTGECDEHEDDIASAVLLDIVEKYNTPRLPCTVRLNGEIVAPEAWSTTHITSDDRISIRPAVSNFLAPLIAALTVHITVSAEMATFLTVIAPIVTAITVGIVGGIMVRALSGKPKSPSSSAFGVTPPGTWNQHTTQQENTSLSRTYGRNRLAGNIIGAWTSIADVDHGNEWYGEDERLSLVIALGRGPVSGIVAGSELINNFPLTEFPSVTSAEKLGTLDQTAFTGLTELILDYRNISEIRNADGFRTYTLPVNDMDDIEIILCHANGIYYWDGPDLYPWNAYVKIEIAEVGQAYSTLVNDTFSTTHLIPLYRTFRASGTYEGGSPVPITRGKNHIIKITKVSGDVDSTMNTNVMYIWGIRPVYTGAFTFPLMSAVFVQALSPKNLGGRLDYSCIQDGAIVNTYNGAIWTLQWSDNPAWAIYDILTQPVISGVGSGPDPYVIERYECYDPSEIDTDSIYAVAQYCDEMVSNRAGGTQKRFTCNGIFDGADTTDAWKAVLSICDSIRCAPVHNGSKIGFIIDQAGTPTQLFCVGNIIEGTLRQTYLPTIDRASEIEITYRNGDASYENATITVRDDDYTGQTRSVNIVLPFCTREAEAWRYGAFNLMQNRYMLRAIEFQAGIDAVVCDVGDLIYFQHDVILPTSITGGRVLSSTPNTITVNRDVSLAGTLKVLVRTYDASTGTWAIQDRSVDSVAAGVVTVSSPWTTAPYRNDPFIIGTSATYNKIYRIIRLTKGSDDIIAIEAVEYSATAYDADTDADIGIS